MSSATTVLSKRPAGMAVRAYVTVSAAVLLALAVLLLLARVRAGRPQAQVAEKLARTGAFERLDFRWPDTALQSLEAAPWATESERPATADLGGGVVLVNLWATWCKPCRTELRDLVRVFREFQSRGVRLVLVSYDDDWDAQKALFDEILGGPPAGVMLLRDPKGRGDGQASGGPDTLWGRLGATGIPETFFVNRGRVVGKAIGDIGWTATEIRDYLDALVGGG